MVGSKTGFPVSIRIPTAIDYTSICIGTKYNYSTFNKTKFFENNIVLQYQVMCAKNIIMQTKNYAFQKQQLPVCQSDGSSVVRLHQFFLNKL